MKFKKTQPPTRRIRQAVPPPRSGPSVVFSYHSGRATEPKADSIRRQAPPRGWVRRAKSVVIIVVAAGLTVYCLSLSRAPDVVVMPEARGQIFLRSMETYKEAAAEIMDDSLLNTNKLTVNTDRIAKAMEQRFPELESVSVTLHLVGRQPVVYIQPARPALLLKTTEGMVLILDDAGRALIDSKNVPKLEKLSLALVDDQSGLTADLGKIVLPGEDVAFISEVAGQLKAKKITLTTLTLPKDNPGQLDALVTGTPYIVKFNLHGDARAQAGAYLSVRSFLEREHKVPSSYVDVRVENKAYYK